MHNHEYNTTEASNNQRQEISVFRYQNSWLTLPIFALDFAGNRLEWMLGRTPPGSSNTMITLNNFIKTHAGQQFSHARELFLFQAVFVSPMQSNTYFSCY